ncbi:MAG: hypothetical protein KY445_15410, partial [Armatimonadetes bacterium]|nr:hypothetical protein [Armatimonadota bacterium]
MSSKRQLAIASWGDPRGAGTWSGTPAHLIAALEKQGVEILDLNCGLPLEKWRLPRIADRIVGRNAEHTLRRLGGKICARLAKNLPSSCAGIVHMGSITVPPAGSTPGVRHFLLCDAMNDFWEKYSPSPKIRNRTPLQRKVSEADECAAVSGTDWFFPIS